MPRRGANIYRRKDGRWEGRIKKGENVNGKRGYISVYGKTYGEVKERMEYVRSQCRSRGKEAAGTLGEAVSAWLEEKRACWKQTTYATYLHMARRHILPGLGDVPLDRVDGELLEGFVQDIRYKNRESGLSNGYLRNVCGVILRSMKHMKKKRHCELEVPENPVSCGKRGQIPVPEEKELAVLERYLLKNVEDDTCLGVLVAFYMGLRIGEVCALTWGDINLEEGIIYVRRNLQRVKAADGQKNSTEILLQTPKTGTSLRAIPIPPVLRPLLEARREKEERYLIKGKRKPWAEPRTLQYRFARILKSCGLESFNFHMLRHAFATRCVVRGFDVKSLSEILGHSSIQITLELYVHSSMLRKKQLMDKFDVYLCQSRFTSVQ